MNDPQTLISEGACYIACAGASATEAVKLALWARLAAQGGITPACVTPNNLLITMTASDPSFTFSMGVQGGGAHPESIVFKWGTVDGGPYPNTKTVPWAASVVLTDPSFVPGTTYFFVAFGLNAPNCQSAGASNQEVGDAAFDPIVSSWATRAVANGGTAPSVAQKQAVNTFVTGCKTDGIWADFLFCDIFCPTITNVTTALTPLLVGTGGFDPRVPNVSLNGQANDLKGLHGVTALNVNVQTGLMTSAVWASDDSAGLSIIVPDFNGLTNPAGIELGCYGPDNVKSLGIACSSAGNSSGWIWNGVFSAGLVASPGIGYYALDRVAANNLKMYFGKTGTPVAQLGATQATPGGGRWSQATFDLRYFALEFTGSGTAPSSSYLSLVVGRLGWPDATKHQLLLNRANTLRAAFGSGGV